MPCVGSLLLPVFESKSLSSYISLERSSYDNPVQSGQSWPVWWFNIHWSTFKWIWRWTEALLVHAFPPVLWGQGCQRPVCECVFWSCFLCHLTLLTILGRLVLARRHGHYHDHSVKADRSCCTVYTLHTAATPLYFANYLKHKIERKRNFRKRCTYRIFKMMLFELTHHSPYQHLNFWKLTGVIRMFVFYF